MTIKNISSKLTFADRWGSFAVRWGLNRNDYKVAPGLYALGKPAASSHILVTANYKLSFDILRRALKGLDVWILVLDTKGINVWCAAGKGTFGTEELVRRINAVALAQVVSQRKLILPQLGASGIAAHKILQQTGFEVVYGPVRAEDLIAFIQADLKTTPAMRQVRFSFYDRLILTPIEIVQGRRYLFLGIGVVLLLSMANKDGFVPSNIFRFGFPWAMNLILAYLGGTLLGPVLLPWLPGRSFSMKGFWSGVIVLLVAVVFGWVGKGWIEVCAWFLLMTAWASFLTMNFTGASSYASPSGVKKEMRLALPLQIMGALIGVGLWVISRFM